MVDDDDDESGVRILASLHCLIPEDFNSSERRTGQGQARPGRVVVRAWISRLESRGKESVIPGGRARRGELKGHRMVLEARFVLPILQQACEIALGDSLIVSLQPVDVCSFGRLRNATCKKRACVFNQKYEITRLLSFLSRQGICSQDYKVVVSCPAPL